VAEERWARIKELFAAASEQPPDKVDAFLAAACGEDLPLRQEVTSLLEASAKAGAFLDSPPELEEPAMPTRVGPWEILRELGRGGMGTVYLAERSDGAFRRQVALKLVRRGLDTEDLLARFRAERQILASLDHPNIARLLDGGAAPDGRPYLVLEYVQGEDLLTWSDRKGLDTPARLELFRQICAAVQYAHRNLVVHRDIKPANVLVGADGVPKLLDFGIAKLLADDPDDRTRTGLRLLTPAYASPEQVRGERVSTASDVWGLGVLLYQLVTGAHPFAAPSASAEETARAVLEGEPVRPSVAARGTPEDSPEGRRRVRALVGDLDNIILRALAKEPERRYASAEHLSDDVRRHLSCLPVRARPDTLRYRAGKFVRRHRWGVTAAGLVLLSLVAGIGGISWQAQRAQAERVRADAVRARAEELVDFMLGDLRRKLEPANRLEVLDDVARAVQAYFAALPATDASAGTTARRLRLLQQLAAVRLAQGRLEDAAGLIDQARPALAAAGGEASADPEILRLSADAANLSGRLAAERGELDRALAEHTASLEVWRRLVRKDPLDVARRASAADAANEVGRTLFFLGRLSEAVARHEEAREALGAVTWAPGESSRRPRAELAKTWCYLGRAREGAGDTAGAEEAFRRDVSLSSELVEQFPADLELKNQLSVAHNDLGRRLRLSGQLAEAVRHHAAALTIDEELRRRDPDNALWLEGLGATHAFLGRVKEEQKDLAGALAAFTADLELSDRLLAREPESAAAKAAVADGMTNVGRVERLLGHLDRARTAHGRALALRLALAAAAPGDASAGSDVGVSRLELGRVLAAEGEAGRARSEWESARLLFAGAAAGKEAPAVQRARLAQALLELGRLTEAEPLVRELAGSGAAEPGLLALARRKGLTLP
jgi:tetratricopeptide (TPR) repeat protein